MVIPKSTETLHFHTDEFTGMIEGHLHGTVPELRSYEGLERECFEGTDDQLCAALEEIVRFGDPNAPERLGLEPISDRMTFFKAMKKAAVCLTLEAKEGDPERGLAFVFVLSLLRPTLNGKLRPRTPDGQEFARYAVSKLSSRYFSEVAKVASEDAFRRLDEQRRALDARAQAFGANGAYRYFPTTWHQAKTLRLADEPSKDGALNRELRDLLLNALAERSEESQNASPTDAEFDDVLTHTRQRFQQLERDRNRVREVLTDAFQKLGFRGQPQFTFSTGFVPSLADRRHMNITFRRGPANQTFEVLVNCIDVDNTLETIQAFGEMLPRLLRR